MPIVHDSARPVQADPAPRPSTSIDSQAARLAREQHLKAGICRHTKEPTHDSC